MQTLRSRSFARPAAAAARPGATAAAVRRRAATPAPTTTPTTTNRPLYDVLGVGQALVDMQFTVDDEGDGDNSAILSQLGVPKGGRRVVSPAERGEHVALLLESGAGEPRISAGGSLSNTLIGLARLGRAAGRPLSVAMGGSVGGDDVLGRLARRELRRAGVKEVASLSPPEDALAATTTPITRETGTVIVVTSRRDAQRSFLACFPPDTSLQLEAEAAAREEEEQLEAEKEPTTALRRAAQNTALLALEGYVLELPGAAEALPSLAALAHAAGARVALAAGDAGVVRRHRQAVRALLRGGLVDVLLANAEEAEALLAAIADDEAEAGGTATAAGAEAAARLLARRLGPGALVSVTDGSRGAYLASSASVEEEDDVKVELAVVPPCWLRDAPVDTTGAGDAYAAGLLFGVASALASSSSSSSPHPLDLHALGAAARRAAGAVIARVGPALTEEDAMGVVAGASRSSSSSSASTARRVAAPGSGGVRMPELARR
jgi:sugar/nucleoside kinase (ribokinase family)